MRNRAKSAPRKGFSTFPQSFPHCYVNRKSEEKLHNFSRLHKITLTAAKDDGFRRQRPAALDKGGIFAIMDIERALRQAVSPTQCVLLSQTQKTVTGPGGGFRL